MSGDRTIHRETVRPEDRLHVDFTESAATHCVAMDPRTGELSIAPIEQVNEILLRWRQLPCGPGALVELSIHLLAAGRTKEALEDADLLAAIARCQPMIIGVEAEEDADVIADALRDHLARLHASHRRH